MFGLVLMYILYYSRRIVVLYYRLRDDMDGEDGIRVDTISWLEFPLLLFIPVTIQQNSYKTGSETLSHFITHINNITHK